MEFNLVFQPQPYIKAQVLMDFVTKWMILKEEHARIDSLAKENLESQ